MIAVNPWWTLAATTAHDFMYGLFLFTSGTWLLGRRQWFIAAVCFACAASARLQFAPLAMAAFIFWLVAASDPVQRRDLTVASLMFVFVAGLLHMPVFIAHHLSFGFLATPVSACWWRDVEQRERCQAYYFERFLLGEPTELWRNRDRHQPTRGDPRTAVGPP